MDSGLVVQARAVGLSKDAVQLDREVEIDGRRARTVDYAYLVCLSLSKTLMTSELT